MKANGAEDTLERSVARIIGQVRREGDRAVVRLTRKYDRARIGPASLIVSRRETSAAIRAVGHGFVRLVHGIARVIAAYHRRQLPRPEMFRNVHGAQVGWVYTPVHRAGLYIPAGTAPLVSTAVMTIVPARVAGVEEIIVATPPGREGGVNPYILAACAELGAGMIVRAGGAQAIAALALGTKRIPRVDLIAGPGNIYVTEAKRQLYGAVGIDMTAGPSEVAVIADGGADAAFIAADLLSQAEHDPLSSAVLFTPSAALASRVRSAVRAQARALPRLAPLIKQGGAGIRIVKCRSLTDAVRRANRMAPEHLQIVTAEPLTVLASVRNAGAVFLGPYSPTALGDYVAGPSHVLPTGGAARFAQGLSVETFLKRISCVRYDRKSLRKAAPSAGRLAEIEGLEAHVRALRIRCAGGRGWRRLSWE